MTLTRWLMKDPALKRPACVLPVVYEGPTQYSGLGVAAFGLLFAGFPVVGVFLIGLAPGASPWMLLPFLLFGLGLVWFGIAMYYWRESFVITISTVSKKLESLYGTTQWEEPLSAYKGLAYRRVLQSMDLKGQLYWHDIWLEHAVDSEKNVNIFTDRFHGDVEQQLQAFAALLKLPVLPHEEYDAGRKIS